MGATPMAGEIVMSEFGVCDDCGREIHKGDTAELVVDNVGYKRYSCFNHNLDQDGGVA